MTREQLLAAVQPFADAAGAPLDNVISLAADPHSYTIRWHPGTDPTTVMERTVHIEDRDT